jgi:hypothetical protein
MVLDHPEIAMDFQDLDIDRETLKKYVYYNWRTRHHQLGYVPGDMPEARVRFHAAEMFRASSARHWWSSCARATYDPAVGGGTRERRYFAVIDGEYEAAAERARRRDDKAADWTTSP